MEMHSHYDPAPKIFKLHPSPLVQPEKYQSAYGNKLALLEHRMQTGYESINFVDLLERLPRMNKSDTKTSQT
jgi:hypothetical protein